MVLFLVILWTNFTEPWHIPRSSVKWIVLSQTKCLLHSQFHLLFEKPPSLISARSHCFRVSAGRRSARMFITLSTEIQLSLEWQCHPFKCEAPMPSKLLFIFFIVSDYMIPSFTQFDSDSLFNTFCCSNRSTKMIKSDMCDYHAAW